MNHNIIQLFLPLIKKMGTDVKVLNDAISFKYYGEPFVAILPESADDHYIIVYDREWYESDLQNLEAFSQLTRTVNNVNAIQPNTIFYTIDTEVSMVTLHSVREVLFIPEIPHLQQYLSEILDEMLMTQRQFCKELSKEKVENK